MRSVSGFTHFSDPECALESLLAGSTIGPIGSLVLAVGLGVLRQSASLRQDRGVCQDGELQQVRDVQQDRAAGVCVCRSIRRRGLYFTFSGLA